jgi:hypothetical protein
MRYIFAFIVFLLLIVLGLVFVFGHHSTPKKPTAIVRTLPDYADSNSSLSMVMDGVINGDDIHRAIRITVTRDSRTLDIIQGYSGRVIDSHTLANTKDAYDIFLRALNTSGFTTKLKKPTGPNDSRGQCPDGSRDVFNLDDAGNTVSSLWFSSCAIGTYGGNPDLTQTLFQRQITDYDNLVSNVQL